MREPLELTAEERAEDGDWFDRSTGRGSRSTSAGAVAFFAGFDRPWWLVGGWSIEAFTGPPASTRTSMCRSSPATHRALRAHVGDRLAPVDATSSGRLGPMTDRYPDLPEPDARSGYAATAHRPWVMDLPVTPDVDGLWQNKQLPDHVAPLDEVDLGDRRGRPSCNPEIVLLFKAAHQRPKDDRDLRALPLLDAGARPGCSRPCGASTRTTRGWKGSAAGNSGAAPPSRAYRPRHG